LHARNEETGSQSQHSQRVIAVNIFTYVTGTEKADSERYDADDPQEKPEYLTKKNTYLNIRTS